MGNSQDIDPLEISHALGDDRVIKLKDGTWAKWCKCGKPPTGTLVIVRWDGGDVEACHPGCIKKVE